MKSSNKEIISSIKNRALNDYTANRVSNCSTCTKPCQQKVAFCIDSYAPGMKIDKENLWKKTSR